MRTSCAIIATNAGFVSDILRDKLRDGGLKVYIADNDTDLMNKIKMMFPRFVFVENCYHSMGTDIFIKRLSKYDRVMKIIVWTVSEMKPIPAARYILAGAESFFSLRDTENNVNLILDTIIKGKSYCPVDVDDVLNRECAVCAVGESLTDRELEVFKLSAKGHANKKIGEILSLSIHTVKYYRASIYQKCGGNSPFDILLNGINKGILCIDDFL